MKNYYDIEELKSIKINDILRDYGIPVNKSGFFSLRNERTPSCKIYAKTNSFYDFGAAAGGNPINLVETLERCSRMEAMDKLASMYGIEPVNIKKNKNEKIMLTDSQYAMIGIAADKATKNMAFDLELDIEELKRISDKYMIPMNDLKEKYPVVYEAIIFTVAVDVAEQKRDIYREEMYHDYVFRNLMKTMEGLSIPSMPPAEEIIRKFGEKEKELNRMEKIMGIACQGCKNIDFKPVNHNAIEEYRIMTAEMDLSTLHQILQENPIWFDAFDSDKSKEILALPKEHNDFSDPDYENAAKRIVETIEKETKRDQREAEHTIENRDRENR